MILTADHVCDAHGLVIDHIGEVIDRAAIRPCDNEIIYLSVGDRYTAVDEVIELCVPGLRGPQSDREGCPLLDLPLDLLLFPVSPNTRIVKRIRALADIIQLLF